MKKYDKFYINGEWVTPSGTDSFQAINPATEQPFATIALGNRQDVDRAVKAARLAFETFSTTSREQRIDLLQRIVEAVREREADLMAAITMEMGSPATQKGHVSTAIDLFQAAIAALEKYEFEFQIGTTTVRREPIGVCGLITPWNWPVQILSSKLASALAAGCTAVVKPSEFTSTSTVIFAEAIHAAGVPPGVFNLVMGDGAVVGNAICSHPDVDLVSFTGSTRAGILVAEAAAPTVKRVCQELGGKSPNVVLQDADLAAAVRWNVGRACANTGQSCHSPTRMLVHESQLEEVLDLLRGEAARVRVGDPLDPATTMGPVVNKSQFDGIQKAIQAAIDDGARVVCGGIGRPEGLMKGYFVKPTILADVTSDMAIAKQEVFGPVVSVMSYATEAEAVEIANGTPYGLGAYVFSGDGKKGTDVGKKLRAGRVFYNGAPGSYAAPMGGYKQSGNGREMGVFGLEEYLEIKSMFGFEAVTT